MRAKTPTMCAKAAIMRAKAPTLCARAAIMRVNAPTMCTRAAVKRAKAMAQGHSGGQPHPLAYPVHVPPSMRTPSAC